MLTIDQLEAFSDQIVAEIAAVKKKEVAIDKEELMKFLQDHKVTDNILLLSLAPHHGMDGGQEDAMWDNRVGFFLLEKTDASNLNRAKYLDIFKRTQAAGRELVDKIRMDKSTNSGIFCNFAAHLEEASISMSPIKALNGCNGYYVELSLGSVP